MAISPNIDHISGHDLCFSNWYNCGPCIRTHPVSSTTMSPIGIQLEHNCWLIFLTEFTLVMFVARSATMNSCSMYSEAIYWNYKKIILHGVSSCSWYVRHRLEVFCWLYGKQQQWTIFRLPNFLVISCSVIVYYLRSKSKARTAMVKMLKNMLLIEAKDKQYLLKRITRETKGKGTLHFDAAK